MNVVLQNVLVAFFAVNALFWGLMPHKVHCEFVSMMNIACPSHTVHLVMGFVMFILAVVFAQWDYLSRLMK